MFLHCFSRQRYCGAAGKHLPVFIYFFIKPKPFSFCHFFCHLNLILTSFSVKFCVPNSNNSSLHGITSSSLTSNVCLGECVSLCILGYASAYIKYIGMCLISLFFIIVCVHVFIHAHASTCCKFVCWSFHVPVCGIYRSGRVCGGVAPVPAGL